MARKSQTSVRPKSTHRKRRTEAPVRETLAPVQDRSRQRHEEILSAASRLLVHANIEDLSHQDIASEAGISKPSVHYHFPTIAAIQRELGRRFDQELSTIYEATQRQGALRKARTWQDYARALALAAKIYFNANRPASEALYGPTLHRENRLASLNYNRSNGKDLLTALHKRFEFGIQQSIEDAFVYNAEILDMFWATSYLRYGQITDRAFEESLRASFGYLRNFLPEILPIRTAVAGS